MSACTDSKNMCCSCPFSFSDESEYAQNTGCLPTPYQILEMRKTYQKTWACHSNTSKPCVGAINHLKNAGDDYHVVDKQLITETCDWTKYVQ